MRLFIAIQIIVKSLFEWESKKTLCLQMTRQRVAWVLISMVSESILVCAVHIKRESALEQGTGKKETEYNFTTQVKRCF